MGIHKKCTLHRGLVDTQWKTEKSFVFIQFNLCLSLRVSVSAFDRLSFVEG